MNEGVFLKKDRRVKSDSDFQKVFKQGKSFANRQFIIYYLERPKQEHFRIGISVSKKIGNAVVRNKMKRYIRQSFLELEGRVKEDSDFIIIVRKPAVDFSVLEVKKSLIHILKKIEKI